MLFLFFELIILTTDFLAAEVELFDFAPIELLELDLEDLVFKLVHIALVLYLFFLTNLILSKTLVELLYLVWESFIVLKLWYLPFDELSGCSSIFSCML